MSLKQDELWLLKPHKHGESLFGLLLNPRPHECLIPNSIPHVRQPMVTLFPPTHLEGDGRDCCGAISLEGAGECSVDLARARLRDRHSHRGSRGSQAHCGTCYLATAQPCRSTAHETEVLAGSSRITSDDAATTPTRVPTGLSRAPPTAAMNQSLHGIRNLNSNPHDLSPEALCLRKA